MTTELQNQAWRSLPKEFKEEVKKYYQTLHERHKEYDRLHFDNARAKVQERIVTLEYFFGIHNLTSDAEGEEMLCVPKKKVQEMYAANERIKTDFPDKETRIISDHINHVLSHLFGSKCLPDEEYTTCVHANGTACEHYNHEESHCSLHGECRFEPKPAEPKYHKGDKVRIKGDVFYDRIGEVTDIDFVGHLVYYKTDRSYEWLKESDLEPYTEPTENLNASKSARLESDCTEKSNSSTSSYSCQGQRKSPNHIVVNSEMVDSIIIDGFKNHNRLHIAAMAMQGLLANTACMSIR